MWMRAVGALRQRLANGLPGARGTGAQGDHFAAVLLLELQRLFERVGVRLVDLLGQVVFRIQRARGMRLQLGSREGTCLMATTIFIG